MNKELIKGRIAPLLAYPVGSVNEQSERIIDIVLNSLHGDMDELREEFRIVLINSDTHYDNDQMHDILASLNHILNLNLINKKGLPDTTIPTLSEEAVREIVCKFRNGWSWANTVETREKATEDMIEAICSLRVKD